MKKKRVRIAGRVGMAGAIGLSAGLSQAEITSFEISGTVVSAQDFDSDPGIWEPIAQGQSWSLSFDLDSEDMVSEGSPGQQMDYFFPNMSYAFNIGDVATVEHGDVLQVGVRTGSDFFEDAIAFSFSSDTHLGISLVWTGEGVVPPRNEMPTADWLNSTSVPMTNPFAFTTNGFQTPSGHVGDLAFLRADTITITPAPMSVGSFAAAGLIAGRRRRTHRG